MTRKLVTAPTDRVLEKSRTGSWAVMIKVQCVRSWHVHVTCSPHPMPYAVNTALVAHFRPDPRFSELVCLSKFLVHIYILGTLFRGTKENHSHELETYVSFRNETWAVNLGNAGT